MIWHVVGSRPSRVNYFDLIYLLVNKYRYYRPTQGHAKLFGKRGTSHKKSSFFRKGRNPVLQNAKNRLKYPQDVWGWGGVVQRPKIKLTYPKKSNLGRNGGPDTVNTPRSLFTTVFDRIGIGLHITCVSLHGSFQTLFYF